MNLYERLRERLIKRGRRKLAEEEPEAVLAMTEVMEEELADIVEKESK